MPLLMPIYWPRTLIHPGTYGTLGCCAAGGHRRQLPAPGVVVSISGDGGFLFTPAELATARCLISI